MAPKTKPARSSFYEIVFRGKPKVVRAFLEGLIIGSGSESTVFYSFLDGIEHDGKAAQLAEMIGIRATECHVIVDAGTSALIKRLAKRIEHDTGLGITKHRKVRSASMDFEFETFASRYDDEIMALLNDLPDSLRMRGFTHEIKRDPDARGVEAYSVAHHFESEGKGTISGPVDALVMFRRACLDYPLIKTEDIELNVG